MSKKPTNAALVKKVRRLEKEVEKYKAGWKELSQTRARLNRINRQLEKEIEQRNIISETDIDNEDWYFCDLCGKQIS